jgi:hypothetical protein
MARGAATFKQQDVTRALKGAQIAGMKVSRIEIDKTGKIVLVTAEAAQAMPEANEWDSVKG